jgi:hypothetical protein
MHIGGPSACPEEVILEYDDIFETGQGKLVYFTEVI